MARRKLPPEVLRQLLAAYDVKGMDDIKAMVKDLVGDTLQDMLACKLDEHLGYERYDTKEKLTDNSRNGHSSKTLRSEYGEIEIEVPRDRKGEFEPMIVPKHQTDISEIEGQIIAMYAKGMSNRDIEEHMRDLYGVKVIYTTNAIENFNRSLRKVTKTKAAWVSDDALTKALHLAIRDITAKWTGKVLGWNGILNQIRIYFGERIMEEDLS